MKIGNIGKIVAIALIITAVSIWVGQLSYGWLPVEAAAESRLIDNVVNVALLPIQSSADKIGEVAKAPNFPPTQSLSLKILNLAVRSEDVQK